MRIKIIDKFLIQSFLQPFAATFSVSVLVLLLQHLWKYIDDLAGKGLEWYVIMEFLVYATANLIPLALPLAILLASIMTFGNLGERYELVSIKAAGVPLRRALAPLFGLVMILTGFAFWFAIEVVPVANLKWGALYYDLLQQKPAFDLKEGVFYNDIQGYSIKVASKNKDGKQVNDVIIYDHTKGRGNTTVIRARYAEISQSDDKRYLFFRLFHGKRYEEMVNQPTYYERNPYNEMFFEEQRIGFDLTQFSLNRTDVGLFKDFWKYKKMPQLREGADSLKGVIFHERIQFFKQYHQLFHHFDTLKTGKPLPANLSVDSLLKGTLRKTVIGQALNNARSAYGQIEWAKGEIQPVETLKAKYELAWWQKITLSVACLILFFIGAPLGAIVRKGGFGLPVVFAIIFFIVFFILNMIGEKMVRELVLPSYIGMWISAIVLAPVGFWLTVKATRDSALFDMDSYVRLFRKLFKRKRTAP